MDAWQHWVRRWFSQEEGRDPKEGEPKRRPQNLLLLVALGLVLLVLARMDFAPPEDSVQNAGVALPPTRRSESESRAGQLEQRVERLLRAMQGVGDVEVMITLEQSETQLFAMERTEERSLVQADENSSVQTIEERLVERPVVIREDQGRTEKPLVITTYEPKVRGVVVLAQGAYDPSLRYEISKVVQTALGVAAHRVHVYAKE